MTRVRAPFVALFLSCPPLLAQTLSPAQPEETGLSSARLGRLRASLRADVEAKKLPGAVAVVARKGRVAYFEAVGTRDPKSGAPMTKDTIFRMYSMTKPFVSVAAMMLVEEGRLALSDPLSKYLPAFSKMHVSEARTDSATGNTTYEIVPAAREITIYDLLRHTSGLAYGAYTTNPPVKDAYARAGLFAPPPGRADYRALTPAQEVEQLAKAPLAHQPGRAWEYGFSTDVLGRVIEVISGKRLGEFLDARIFKPLQMPDTAFWVPADRAGRLAQPFETDPATGQPITLYEVLAPPKNDSGGAGAVSTASDYLRFCEMLLHGGELDGVRILSRSSVVLMTSDHLGKILEASPSSPGERMLRIPGYTFGLGFAVRREDGLAPVPGRAGAIGWGGASGTYFFIDPQEELIGILLTQEPGSRVHDRTLFQQLVYGAIAD